MKRIYKLLVLVAFFIPMLSSCSGGNADSIPFGIFPSEYEKFLKESEKLKAEAQNIKTDEDKAEYIKKTDKLKEEWREKLETAAKTVDGKPIEFSESDIKVTEPISLTFESLKKTDLEPFYRINGAAEASKDISVDPGKVYSSLNVYMVGYDSENQEMFASKVGTIAVDKEKNLITAGTPVKLYLLSFVDKYVEDYLKVKTLKLEVR